MNLQRILVTTDFSPIAEQAIQPAAEMAQDSDATLILVHVMEARPPKPDPKAGHYKAAKAIYETDQEREAKRLAELEERLKRYQGLSWKAVIGRGEAIPTILSIAEKERADLLVISSSGRTGFKRLLLGSVAEELARSSPLPVLIWKAPKEPS